MTLDERMAELRVAIDEEVARVLSDFVRVATKVRGSAEALEEASRAFAGYPAALDFLKSLAPARISPQDDDLRAQRFARVRVAEIQLYHASAMKSGRSAGDVYGALKTQMDEARAAYREKFLTPVNGTADYLHVEFVRTLANDDAALLGPGYPGPLA